MTTKKIPTTKIKLCAEAASALKYVKYQPSDSHLLRMVNGYGVNDMPSSAMVRWMAIQILSSYGYTFEA